MTNSCNLCNFFVSLFKLPTFAIVVSDTCGCFFFFSDFAIRIVGFFLAWVIASIFCKQTIGYQIGMQWDFLGCNLPFSTMTHLVIGYGYHGISKWVIGYHCHGISWDAMNITGVLGGCVEIPWFCWNPHEKQRFCWLHNQIFRDSVLFCFNPRLNVRNASLGFVIIVCWNKIIEQSS